MLAICLRLAAAIHGYLAFYMPTNRAVDWLRSPGGIKWAIPVAIVAIPTYLFAMSVCMTILERGGPGYLNVLVMLFAWNAIKFAVVGVLAPLTWLGRELRERSVRHRSLHPALGVQTQPVSVARSTIHSRSMGSSSAGADQVV